MSNPLFDALKAARSSARGDFLIKPDGGVISVGQFFDLAERLSQVLINSGVQAGDRVAVQVPKSAEALALYVGCIRCGAVFLPLNTAYTESELRYFIDDAEPAVFVVDPASAEIGERLVTREGSVPSPVLLTLGSEADGTVLAAAIAVQRVDVPVARSEQDLAAILYTSGTTGRSKGAMLSHGNLLSNARTLLEEWRFSEQDVLLHALPIFHTHGLFVACHLIMLSGARMIFEAGFDIERVLERLPNANVMMGVPTFYTRLLNEARFDKALVSHMRLFVSGSAPLLAETHRSFEQRTGQRILERYGMTETNMNTSNPYEGERRAGTVGHPLPGVEVRICDPETGLKVERGSVGVLQVRGPNVFSGYWRMPEKTREELLEDGFFITGDLATQDDDGYIIIVGRGKDLIISGGYNIYPRELELLIDAIDGVLESAVVGAPDADFGECVVAFVILDGSVELDTAGIKQALQNDLARFKMPKRVEFINELPRNTMGKVQKNELRALMA